jgi:hypothetical protein
MSISRRLPLRTILAIPVPGSTAARSNGAAPTGSSAGSGNVPAPKRTPPAGMPCSLCMGIKECIAFGRCIRGAEASAQDRGFAGDLLRGADEIAEFLFGDRKLRRKVYHLAASRLPVFKLGGSMLCARKSVLLKFVGDQERRGRKDED